MARGFLVWGSIGLLVGGGGMLLAVRQGDEARQRVTGKRISPQGTQTEVGSYPVNMALSPNGRYAVVTNVGARQQLSVLDVETGKLVSSLSFNRGTGNPREGLYYGLAFAGERLFVARGAMDKVTEFSLSQDGVLTEVRDISNPGPKDPSELPFHIAGLATSPDGQTIYAVNNQSHAFNGFTGSVSALSRATGKEMWRSKVEAFPLPVSAPKSGPASGSIFVASEREGIVSEIDGQSGTLVRKIPVGAQPAYTLLDRDSNRLFVSNSGSDTVSAIDLASRKVRKTILLRPSDLKRYAGSTPLGMALSPDEKHLYVAMADLNAIAVVDLVSSRCIGYIDAGWYPTSMVVSASGNSLLVANARGTQTRNPNATKVRNWGTYIQDILEGTVSTIDLRAAESDLAASTARVLANNNATGNVAKKTEAAFGKLPIEHVVYIVKENRTYDQVLGDLPRGNGDPKLTLFGREVTPNLHAIAERFVQLDNFYVCAEVSADGWPWSTQGSINAYTSRNVTYNYSRRGRNYDFEGVNNGSPVDLLGQKDVARHEGGYIWEAMAKAGRSFRNYGFFTSFGDDTKGPDGKLLAVDNSASKKLLASRTSPDFRRYDMAYADSEAWVKYGLKPAPAQMATYGAYKDPSRVTAWLREFRGFEKNNNFPNFSMLRLGRDHTSGTSVGQYSSRACVADNDYAVGQIVEAISHSRYWEKTAIFILEDDAQAGFDHVDAHRSTAYVVSPLIQKGTLDSRFYNTVSLIRTMELILGVKPHNQYLATAAPFGFFQKQLVNSDPFKATLPAKEIVAEVNRPSAYRAADSTRLIARMEEESAPDFELNDILWGSIKGAETPRPKTPGAVWKR